MIKPLLFYMQAANYPDIIEELNKIPCDKFITRYYAYPHPHNLAKKFFLEHEEYTHLIVHPQDLLVKKENFDKLIKEVEKNDYPVLSGVCNIEAGNNHNAHKWGICKECPSRDFSKRFYNFIPITDEKMGIMRVGFQGMVFCCIKRNIIERTLINGEPVFEGRVHCHGNAPPDLNFCLNCKELGIPIHADLDNRMYHYANHLPNLVNKLPASTIFLKNGEKLNYESEREISSSSQSLQG